MKVSEYLVGSPGVRARVQRVVCGMDRCNGSQVRLRWWKVAGEGECGAV